MSGHLDHDHFYSQEFKQDLEFLEELVQIDSRSKKHLGVEKVQRKLATRLIDLGFDIEWVKNPSYESADLLVARLKGNLPKRVVHIGHADTVLGPSSAHRFLYDKEKNHLRGPGIADNKGGLLVALRGIAEFVRTHHDRPELVFISSPSEEIGSLGLHHEFKKWGSSSDIVLGFEPALKDGSIIQGRNGNRWYKIHIKGKPFHAGRFGEPSLNAAHEAAIKIVKLASLEDENKRLKVNVGSFSGGQGHYNIICGDVEILLDTRFPCFRSRDQLHQQIEEILMTSSLYCRVTGEASKTLYCIEDDCPPMAPSHDPENYISSYLESLSLVEKRIVSSSYTGGAADINYFSTGDNLCLDGLGPIAGGMHTTSEYIELNSLVSRGQALSSFLAKVSLHTTTATRSH